MQRKHACFRYIQVGNCPTRFTHEIAVTRSALMSTTGPCCEFVQKLLGLQQDGREAISAPANWTRLRPLLEVPTDLDTDIDGLARGCLLSSGKDLARWHFFVGSPGNGKSTAVGKLARKLITEHACRIAETESGLEIDRLDKDLVPYSLDVYESGKTFASARIVQDASVVKKPYANDAEPARDLLETLDDAWVRGISLVVCTNRGVIEGALADADLSRRFKDTPWFKSILRRVANNVSLEPSSILEPLSFTSKRPVFSGLELSVRYLDSHSLLLGGNRTFELLVEEAVQPDKWTVCETCSAKNLCPFRSNMLSLANHDGRDLLVKIIRRAEVFSTQVLVFREALALLSYILAGCARDYRNQHPCDWVRDKVAKGDIFALGSRRTHMCLFSSGFPRGLESDPKLKQSQRDALLALSAHLPTDNPAKLPLHCALNSEAPSTDVGIPRLLGLKGVFSKLDPLNGPLPAEFWDAWDVKSKHILNSESTQITELDRQCVLAWCNLENCLENMPSLNAPQAYWSIGRWSSQYTLHLGAYATGLVSHGQDLDNFAQLLELLWKQNADRNPAEKAQLRELKELVRDLLTRKKHGVKVEDGIRIARHVRVTGNWAAQSLEPKVERSPASGSLTISVKFGDARHHATLAAPTYLWLQKRANGTMDERCIPDELLAEAMDAKARALASSQYAFVLGDVIIQVDSDLEKFTLARYEDGGEVIVNANYKS